MVDTNNVSAGDARQVDFSAAMEFLTLLDPDPNALFTFQTFDDNRTEPKRSELTKVLHATRDQMPAVWPKLALLNAGGAGVFVTVNCTNGRGRKGNDIVRVRALYIDLDGAPLEPVLSSARPPHIVVCTSPGRYHCYWLVQGMPLEDFRGAQEALIDAFGSDRNVKSIEHVMRVPAFMHRKGEPFLVNIHSKNERPPYRADEFAKTVQPVRTPNADSEPTHLISAQMVVPFITNPDLDWDDWNRRGMAIFRATSGCEEGFELFDALSRKSAKYNARTTRARWQHYHRSPPERIGIGSLFHWASQSTPDWRDQLDKELMEDLERAARECSGRSLYELCGVADPEEQAAGEPAIKKRAPELPPEQPQAGAAEQPKAETPPRPEALPPPRPEPSRPHSVLHWHGEARPSNAPWLVKNLMLQTGAGLVSGQWGTGKTFIVIHLAGCVMTGKDFVGYRVRRKGGVLFIAKEGKAALPLRLAVMVEHTLGRKDDAGLLPFAWADIPLNLLAQGSAALIALAKEAATEMQRRFGVPLVLIIIDTVPAAAGYKKEGEGAEGTFVMNALHALSEATGAFVLGVEHFGKDIEAGTRGTMTKEDRADTILALIGERTLAGQVSNLRLGVRKVREGESGREIPFRLELIDCGVDEDGDQVTSRIVHWELDRPVRPAAARQSKSSTIFATALQAALDAHGNRQLFTELVAVPEYEVRKIFLTNYTAEEEVSAAAARERWRKARDRAIVTETVELRRDGDVSYLCCPVAAVAM